jgi:hypothetical protein
MSTNTYYVQGKIDPTGRYAQCSYFTDPECTKPATSPLGISQRAGVCNFAQAASSELALVGSVYKTVGNPSSLNNHNFAPANDEGVAAVSMPTGSVVTKGVVLIFANRDKVESLYPSDDPEVVNDQP